MTQVVCVNLKTKYRECVRESFSSKLCQVDVRDIVIVKHLMAINDCWLLTVGYILSGFKVHIVLTRCLQIWCI